LNALASEAMFVVKILLLIVLAFATLIFLGVNGFYFKVWPTFLNDKDLNISAERISGVKKLLEESKFHLDKENLYFFPLPEEKRIVAQNITNNLINDMLVTAEKTSKKSDVLFYLKNNLHRLDTIDSEEQDRALIYLEKTLSIIGIESSNQLLNVWRYGFPIDGI
jgi:hypothetical protein